MTDLTTTYLGRELKNPLVVSASPLSKDLGKIRQLEDAGASAIVLHSLFEEQLDIESQELHRFLSEGAESFAESLSYFPDQDSYNLGPDAYLDHIRASKDAVDIPVIASLNGISTGGWIDFARRIEEAGADALELNIYYLPTSLDRTGGEVEQMYLELLGALKAEVSLPIALKLGPYFSSMANMARQFDDTGADALVIFNRFYQPDLDLEELEVVPNLKLSTSQELLLRLRWAAILYGRIKADIAITGGVHTAADAIKGLMAGANVVMMTSALLMQGPSYLAKVLEDMSNWLDWKEYESVRQLQGSMSQQAVADPAAFERANYIKVLSSYVMPTT